MLKPLKKFTFILTALAISVAGSELLMRGVERVVLRRNPWLLHVRHLPAFRPDPSARRYVRTRYHPMRPRLSFPISKGARTYRVFVLGGSASAGRPFPPRLSFYGFLQRKLEAIYPGWTIEMVGSSTPGYGSRRISALFEEIADYEPDLVIVYSGNNEFIDQPLGVGSERYASAAWLRRSALVRTLANAAFAIQNEYHADLLHNFEGRVFRGAPSDFRVDPRLFDGLVKRYESNLDEIAQNARRKDVKVLFLTVPVNLKDWMPNASFHAADLTPARREEWKVAYAAGRSALEAGDPATAVENLTRAARLDPSFARAHYELGRALQKTGRREESLAAYRTALETDGFPVRALPVFNDIIRRLARRRGVPLADIAVEMERAAKDGIPGLDIFVDHCHLRVSSNERAAQAVLRAIRGNGLSPDVPGRPEGGVAAVDGDGPERTPETLAYLFHWYVTMNQTDKVPDVVHRWKDALNARYAGSNGGAVDPPRRLNEALDEFLAAFYDYKKSDDRREIDGDAVAWEEAWKRYSRLRGKVTDLWKRLPPSGRKPAD